MKLYSVILAGGIGKRFWPMSKINKPKHLLKFHSNKTMLEDTIERVKSLMPPEDIFIVTNTEQKPEIVKLISDIPVNNILTEPFGKNTAACIALASVVLHAKDPKSVMLVVPSDHIIRDLEAFKESVKNAYEFAKTSGGLVTIGIKPVRPETGYGYIQINEKEVAPKIHKVYTYAEKPNYATAVRFIESGDFFWNSGMFIWRADVILDEIRIHMPDVFEGMMMIKESINTPGFESTVLKVYGRIKNISIDYGVMEKSNKLYLTKGDFDWSDVGTWEEVYLLSDKNEHGNVLHGKIFCDMTVDSFIYSPEKFTSIIGADNLIVVNTNDALLICRRDQAQEVQKVIDYLKINKHTEFL